MAVPKPFEAKRADTHDLKRRFEDLYTDRANVNGIWDQVERYIAPLGSSGRPSMTMSEQSVTWPRYEVWDSTAIDCSGKLAASIHSSVTSASGPWSRWKWRDKDLRKNTEANAWLEECCEIFFNEIFASDFTPEVQACYQDLTRPGHCLMAMEAASDTDEWQGFDFSAIPLREGFFEEDAKGGIHRFFRLMNWTPVQWVDKFKDACPRDVADKAIAGDVKERKELVFCVFMRPDVEREMERRRKVNRQRGKQRRAAAEMEARARLSDRRPANGVAYLRQEVPPDEPLHLLAPTMRPVGGVYFDRATGEQIGEERGYYMMPIFQSPWERTTGSRWGHGPGIVILPTVKYLNALVELKKTALEKVVDPVHWSEEGGIFGDYDMEPGGEIIVRNKDAIGVFESKANFAVTDQEINDLRGQIQRAFHTDELQLKDSPQMTAMEAQIRYELMQRILGAPLNRIETNLLGPVQMVGFDLLMRAGRFPPPPAAVRDAIGEDGPHWTVEYLGPLARAQRTDKVASIERLLAYSASLLKMGLPSIYVEAKVKLLKSIGDMADALGIPADMLESDDTAEKKIADWRRQQAQAAQAEMQKTQSEAAANHANAQATLGQLPPGGPGAVQPTAAQPGPLVSPSFQSAAPFQQPPTPEM